MITIEEAIQLIKENLPEKKVELRATYTCNGFVLAEDVYAQYSSPYFDNSAMDGYALSTEDTEFLIDTYEPKEFDVIGTSQAGIPFMGRIPKGKCIQVNTGAKIPENTGAIVPVEDVEFINHNKIKIKQPIKKFQHIRRKGEEFKENTLLLTKNTKLNPRNIAMLLQAGKFEIFVYKKPKILIVTTGNELTPFNENLEEEDIKKVKSSIPIPIY
jgi:molybdopterin molybdotransferase